ncbi:MAG: sigma-54-dependent Fis family transcriptional regulator [Myxococcales bacterium]|nr:sigma-54-dependent Fis family transcriptional regulator [Myxococcales bacterium]MCB9578018.1 sigma-54-dependent Fis family transcriptional regulator [Polyangiaceae bacterium]
MRRTPTLLIVAEDEGVARELSGPLLDSGIGARRVNDVDAAVVELGRGEFDVVVVDGARDVPRFVERAGAVTADLPVLVLVDAIADGVAAVRAGAQDFLRKPLDREEVLYVVGKALELSELSEDEPPRSMVMPPELKMVGRSAALKELLETLQRAAAGVATVLVRGESGSGKELVARLVHQQSPRRTGPFVKVHCAALPDNLLESELFGYEKGAFTGATSRKPGRVELAEGGTLFLDEIGDITPATQVKLLRLLQDRQYERLGGTETLSADVRFVTATHRDLEDLVRKGEFREDLFYRLNVVTLWVPPLRARPDDIEPLALGFCESVARANGRSGVAFDVEALELLQREQWPGNVRQLQNFVERLVVLASGPRISAQDVNRELKRQAGTMGFAAASGYGPQISMESSVIDLAAAVKKAERRAIEKALKSAKGNRNLAARLLGISRRSLYYKLQEFELG